MNEINRIFQSLGELHAKVDRLLESDKDQETRVQRLERSWAKVTGVVVAVTIICNVAVFIAPYAYPPKEREHVEQPARAIATGSLR
jgi:hypothetical protein